MPSQKKLVSFGIAAYIALSPMHLEAAKPEKGHNPNVVSYKKGRYIPISYKGVKIHSFLANLGMHKGKVASDVCPHLPELKPGEPNELIFLPSGKILENIVAEYESSSGRDVLAAI